jgi:transcription antitermination factor NusA-like protein
LKMQLCNFCVKSGILCQKCQEKVRSGEVSEIDIRVAKLLLKLEGKHPPLQKIFFHNAYDFDNVLVIVVEGGNAPQFLTSRNQILRDISERTRRRVIILEKRGNTRKFLEDLFIPAKIMAINKIWLPDGSTETRVILPGHSGRLSMGRDVLKELAEKIRGITLRITFEDQEEKY